MSHTLTARVDHQEQISLLNGLEVSSSVRHRICTGDVREREEKVVAEVVSILIRGLGKHTKTTHLTRNIRIESKTTQPQGPTAATASKAVGLVLVR